MDVEMTWDYKCVIFAEDYVGLEGNKLPQLKPSLSPHHNRGGDMRSSTRGFLELAVVGCCVDKTIFSSTLVLTPVYEMVISMSETENTHNRKIRGNECGGIEGGY